MKIFHNITWPEGAIYNITTNVGSKLSGGADVEKTTVQEKEKLTAQQRNAMTECGEQVKNDQNYCCCSC